MIMNHKEREMSVIRELYYGNIGGVEDFKPSAEWDRLLKKDSEQCGRLLSVLGEKEKVEFEKYQDLILERCACEVSDMFEYAFSLGLSLGYESGSRTKGK